MTQARLLVAHVLYLNVALLIRVVRVVEQVTDVLTIDFEGTHFDENLLVEVPSVAVNLLLDEDCDPRKYARVVKDSLRGLVN